ncbi:hypothetical protein QTP70_032257 [Hemibagrus guttatus]|uniref:Ig-like domain-containing protein n=1 Tax=Hemibagrus guttatus TaxID=175788 RepID=A0AAE0UMX8_9TELE|nr:hypothetical protein QTP70_032257 [Hemibagrus guttatus]
MLDIFLIFTVYLISVQVGFDEAIEVVGYEGGSVIISCKYNSQEHSNHTKYFCKTNKGKCENIISQRETNWDLKGKFLAVDEVGVHSVFIRNLSQEDGGSYTCRVENQKEESLLNVELDVKKDLNYGKSFSLKTHPGDTITFSCTYPEGHENGLNIVYRVTNHSIDAIIFTYTEHEEKDRYELHVSPEDKVINMSISNLTVDDGGLYLCGVSKDNYVQIFSEMQLHVTASGSLVISIVLYVGVALLLITGIVFFYKMWSIKTKGPNPSVVIILSVCVVLLLFAIVLYLFLKWKRKHDLSSSSNTDHLNNRQFPQLGHTAEDYNNIKHNKHRTDLHAVCNNIETSTDPSESPTGLDHTSEDYEEIPNINYHPHLCSVNTITEAPEDPSDTTADVTQSLEYTSISHCSEAEAAYSSAI